MSGARSKSTDGRLIRHRRVLSSSTLLQSLCHSRSESPVVVAHDAKRGRLEQGDDQELMDQENNPDPVTVVVVNAITSKPVIVDTAVEPQPDLMELDH
jgi:hypothetical protein